MSVAIIQERLATYGWERARRDVQRFVKSHELPSLQHWSRDFFMQQCAKLA